MLQRLIQSDCALVYSRPLLAELMEKLELPRIKEKHATTDNYVADPIVLFVLRRARVIPDRQVTNCRDPEKTLSSRRHWPGKHCGC